MRSSESSDLEAFDFFGLLVSGPKSWVVDILGFNDDKDELEYVLSSIAATF